MGGTTRSRGNTTVGNIPTAAPSHEAPDGPRGGGMGGGDGGAPGGCDIHLDVDLAGVRVDVVSGLVPGDVLDVLLHPVEGFEAVACMEQGTGRVAGTLANVEGIDRMIGCLRAGHRYRAVVIELGALRCHVLVDPVRI